MLEEKIYKDYVESLKKGDKERAGFLSFARSELKNIAINSRKDKLNDDDVLIALKALKKRLEETKASIASSTRVELIQKADRELAFVNEYLPQPLDDAELVALIEAVISETGASSPKDMGKVMKEIMARAGVRLDAKKASDLVKAKLSSA